MIDFKKVEQELSNVSTVDRDGRHFMVPSLIVNEQRVYDQAIRHNYWIKEIDLIKKKFPMEPKAITDYRNENKRQFTKEVPKKINQEVVNILSHLQIRVESENPLFVEWMDSNPFKIKDSSFDFKTWSVYYLLNKSLIDPNAILVPYPEFIDKSKNFNILTKLIPFNKKYIDPKGGYIAILEDGSQYKTFLVADEKRWYRLRMESGNKWEELAEHRMNELPYVFVPGISSEDTAKGTYYQESLISSTYEYCDEALVAFSTDQAVRIMMTPKLFRPVTGCLDCGAEGTIKNKETGLESECQSCKGTGIGVIPGEFADWVYKPSDFVLGDEKKVPTPMYVSPEVALGQFHSDTVDKYMAQAKRTCGIDSLIDQQESGEAMKHRLATLESFIQYIISLQYQFVLKKYLEMVFKLLEWDRPQNWTNLPTIITPKRVEIKTPEILKLNYESAIGSEKIQAAIEYFNSIYADDPINLRAMRLSIEEYPSSVYKTDELETLKAINAYKETEISRGLRAFLVFRKILSIQGNMQNEDQAIIELANTELQRIIPEAINTAEIS